MPSSAPSGDNQPVEVKDEADIVEVMDSDDVDSSSTSSEEPRPDVVKFSPVVQPREPPEGYVMWQHSKLKTLHLMSKDNKRVFACGRMAGSLHNQLESAPEFDTPLCSSCFSKKREL